MRRVSFSPPTSFSGDRPRCVQSVHESIDLRHVTGARRAPIVQARVETHPMGEPMRDGEAAGAIELGEHDDHLPANVENIERLKIQRFKCSTCR